MNSEKLEQLNQLRELALELGAHRAEIVDVAEISMDAKFREMCESNACGNFGRCHMCPPDIGDIHELMERLGRYEKALVYQTVGELEDSYDFEGMMEVAERHNELAQRLRERAEEVGSPDALHLGAGGCRVCEVCAKKTDEPCRFPEKAMGSLEAYGVNVSKLAELAGMRYINGQDTVTYFGGAFFPG